MIYSFRGKHAREYNLGPAVVLYHIGYWINFNRNRGQLYIDGRTWTHLSYTQICQRLPFMTEHQVKEAVKQLVAKGVLIRDQKGKGRGNRKNWYALVDEDRILAELADLDPEEEQEHGGNFNGENSTTHGGNIPDPSGNFPPLEINNRDKEGRDVSARIASDSGAPKKSVKETAHKKATEVWHEYVASRTDGMAPRWHGNGAEPKALKTILARLREYYQKNSDLVTDEAGSQLKVKTPSREISLMPPGDTPADKALLNDPTGRQVLRGFCAILVGKDKLRDFHAQALHLTHINKYLEEIIDGIKNSHGKGNRKAPSLTPEDLQKSAARHMPRYDDDET